MQIGNTSKMLRRVVVVCLLFVLTVVMSGSSIYNNATFIKWIDFNVSATMIERALSVDMELKSMDNPDPDISICELLAYIATRNGNRFNLARDTQRLEKLKGELEGGDKSSLEKYRDNKYYKYYVEAYHAILDGLIGGARNEYGHTKYGVKAYHPIARGFWYSCYDDFGNARGYGFRRKHLGHDIFGSTGAPIIAVESGTVAQIGWNQYGGWRIGIRSDDTKRYYYYAHLRKDSPYAQGLKEGDRVEAGDVIGFLGVTGYSRKENVNMKTKPHLHFGMQIIFDESQVKGPREIWIDCHEICKFLSRKRASVVRNPETKEWERYVPTIVRDDEVSVV